MIDTLAWIDVPEASARGLLAQLVGAEDPDLLGRFEVAGKAASLPSYRHWRLLWLRTTYCEPAGSFPAEDLYALWREGYPPGLLDGTPGAIFVANEDESLRLDASTVGDYVRLFCFAVRGGEGPFILFEKAGSPVPPGAEAVSQLATPLAVRGLDGDGSWLVDATMIYTGFVFRTVLTVQPGGALTMIEDTPVDTDLPPEVIPRVPELSSGSFIRVNLSAIRAGIASMPAPAGGAKASASGRPALIEMVELLLERALIGQAHNRLIEHFNATAPLTGALQQFAALMVGGSPVVVVETDIPFVEETIAQVVLAHAPTGQTPGVCRADVVGDDIPISFALPSSGSALVLIPLQVYRNVAQVERLAFDIATRDMAVVITCERFAHLPECLRRLKDIVLRLPAMDAAMFGELFRRVIGHDLPPDWDKGGTAWLRHLLHTDFEHPRRMHLSRDQALDFIRSQVTERLTAVDPGQGLSLSQLHGLGEARQFAEDLIADIHAAIAGTLSWSQVDRGALLVGPPGTGKTTLAKAIAKDCGVRFITASPTGWQSAGGSLGPHIDAIRKTFSEARRYAPSILFIDEIDSIGNREDFAGTNNSIYQTEVVNAVLEQMQGLDPTAPVFVIGATNHEARVDPALRRAGRLDRVIRIPRPNSESLEMIYHHYLGTLGSDADVAPDLDLRSLGRLSVGLTGADVERIVRGAVRRGRKAGRPLSQNDLMAEITNKPRDPSASLRLTPDDIERTAVHEAGHALAHFLTPSKGADIGFVTVVPRDDGTLGFVATLPDERVHLTRGDCEDKIDIFLAGRAAEALRYGEEQVSSGASSDLKSATALVVQMITKLGLGGKRKLLWSESMSPADLALAEETLSLAHDRVLGKLRQHEKRLAALTQALVDRQELSGDEVCTVLESDFIP